MFKVGDRVRYVRGGAIGWEARPWASIAGCVLSNIYTVSAVGVDSWVALAETDGLSHPDHFKLVAPAVKPGDWINSLSSAERKELAMYRGLMVYFPDALAAIARHSFRANEKHNPGEPLHWSRDKSPDHLDCIGRHLTGAGTLDTDGSRHSTSLGWRALANLQLEIEAAQLQGEKV